MGDNKMQSARHSTSLYDRLGGATGIAAIVDDIVDAHMQNPAIKARFLPAKDDPAHFAKVKQHLCDFFAAGSGGPVQYTGRSMPESHRGMNIGEAEYMAALDDIMAALISHGIDDQTRNDVLAIAFGLKGEILHK